MKNKMQILGRISLGLLICIILGQGIWLYRVREMENHGFEQTVGRGLNDILWVEVIFLIGKITSTHKILFSLAKGCGEKD